MGNSESLAESPSPSSASVAGATSLRDVFDRHGGSSGYMDAWRLSSFLQDLMTARDGGVDGAAPVDAILRACLAAVNIDARGRVAFEELRRALIAVEEGVDSAAAAASQVHVQRDAGHVFVLLADLRKLSCDTWVIPCGPTLMPDARWQVDPADFAGNTPELPGGARIRLVPQWPAAKPQPFVLNTHPAEASKLAGSQARLINQTWVAPAPVDASKPMDLQWVHESLTLYLDAALRYCRERGRKPRNRRAKFLIALPLLASKLAPQFSGQLIREILPVLYGFAIGNGIDVALATIDRTVFAVMQAERARWNDMVVGKCWADLSAELQREGERLADFASRDELALFLGAGVSIGAGLPSWAELLSRLAKRCMSGDDLNGLTALPFIDQARVIGERMGGTEHLAAAIAQECRSPVFSVSHALLASLPIREVVTSNYDVLFEEASKTCVSKVATLPYEPSTASDRWVLKLHGCINHTQDIVLTREQYLRYDAMRAALGGIVQAMLITKQMVFVGFSLQDENFHRIIDAVRRALSHSDLHGEAFGTALFLARERFMSVLWRGDLRVVPMTDEGSDIAESARVLEVFLDYLSSKCQACVSGQFLLDAKFVSCLDPPARALRDHLLRFLDSMPREAHASPLHSKLLSVIHGAFGQRDQDVLP